MPNLYILSGCHGSRKCTPSFTVLPAMTDCDIFINADEIELELLAVTTEN
jgi:predicted ABC-type ATPase